MIDIITVGNTVWNIDRRNPLGSGIDASAFESKTYPDVVLLLFSKKFEYKYDWYQYLDLIMGESEWKDRHVLILPKMAHISIPQWYGMLGYLMRGRSMQNSLYVANQYLDGIYPLHEEDQWAADDPYLRDPLNINIPIPEEFKFETKKPLTTAVKMLGWLLENVRLSPNLDLWASTLYDFFNTFPQYNSDKYQFDFNKYNIMKDGRRYIITDPIID